MKDGMPQDSVVEPVMFQ